MQSGKTALDIALEQQHPAAASMLAEALAGRGVGGNDTPTGVGDIDGTLMGPTRLWDSVLAGSLASCQQQLVVTSEGVVKHTHA